MSRWRDGGGGKAQRGAGDCFTGESCNRYVCMFVTTRFSLRTVEGDSVSIPPQGLQVEKESVKSDTSEESKNFTNC